MYSDYSIFGGQGGGIGQDRNHRSTTTTARDKSTKPVIWTTKRVPGLFILVTLLLFLYNSIVGWLCFKSKK